MKSIKHRGNSQSSVAVAVVFLTAVMGLLLYLSVHRAHKFSDTIQAAAGAAVPTKNTEAEDECRVAAHHEHGELWGDVVKPGALPDDGGKGLKADSATTCCKSCQSTKGCNIWVWCSDPAKCEQQCWLKRVGSADGVQEHSKGDAIPWTSGKVAKDYDRDVASLPAVDHTISTVALTTSHGIIRIRLHPDWSEGSVEFVRRLAMTGSLCTQQCEFYRAEPGFLLQGSMQAYIPANNKTTPGPKFMERGDIGWAGGSAGPHFFIYLSTQPAKDWNHDHTVWGEVADAESMAVVDKIVVLPTGGKPGEMRIMEDREAFNMSVA